MSSFFSARHARVRLCEYSFGVLTPDPRVERIDAELILALERCAEELGRVLSGIENGELHAYQLQPVLMRLVNQGVGQLGIDAAVQQPAEMDVDRTDRALVPPYLTRMKQHEAVVGRGLQAVVTARDAPVAPARQVASRASVAA